MVAVVILLRVLARMSLWRKQDIKCYSSADMCLNCSLSVKSTKIGMMTVFKALKKIGYGAIAKTTVKGHLKGSFKTAAILNRK